MESAAAELKSRRLAPHVLSWHNPKLGLCSLSLLLRSRSSCRPRLPFQLVGLAPGIDNDERYFAWAALGRRRHILDHPSAISHRNSKPVVQSY